MKTVDSEGKNVLLNLKLLLCSHFVPEEAATPPETECIIYSHENLIAWDISFKMAGKAASQSHASSPSSTISTQ